MQLDILCSGPLKNNVIVLHDGVSRDALVIDPSFEPEQVLEFVNRRNLVVRSLLFTHGHCDHFAGLSYLLANLTPRPSVGLHQDDLDWWRDGGGAAQWRLKIDTPDDPDFFLSEGEDLELGGETIQVRHTPGHSPGSVIFYLPALNTALVGDLIFRQGVGRTDLTGGSFQVLRNSIETKIYTLPPETVLIPGHGPSTTVAQEKKLNPYVNSIA